MFMSTHLPINVEKLRPGASELRRGSSGAAGIDVAYCGDKPVHLWPHEVFKFTTGWAFEVPPGIAMLILPRSGLSTKVGLRPVNTPGLLDPDYRGELIVALEYRKPDGQARVTVNPGDYIAQIMFVPFLVPMFRYNTPLSKTERGTDGFGSTDDKRN